MPRARRMRCVVHTTTAAPPRVATLPTGGSPVAATWAYECEQDGPRVALPHAEIQVVARFGVPTRHGLDVHAMGVSQRARRKVLRRGQRAVSARLRWGVTEAVLGVSAAALSGRVVALEDLWGDVVTERLREQLADARDTVAATAVLERALVERAAVVRGRSAPTQLALEAAKRLPDATVHAVAIELGVSERHLRRLFHETLGVSPKAFARLTRFHRALRAARAGYPAGWAGVAAASGYYDQAHLIAEFRAIAGVTPRELLGELRCAAALQRA